MTSNLRILFVQLGSASELIMTLPVACAARDHFPYCWIGWAGSQHASALLAGHPAIDQWTVFPDHWIQSASELSAVREQLSHWSPEIAIHLDGKFSGACASWLSGAKRRISVSGKPANILSRLLNNECLVPVFSHVTDRTLELLTPLGIHTPSVKWDIRVPQNARLWATHWRRSQSASRIAVLHPGAIANDEDAPVEPFAQVASYIHDRYGYQSVVIWHHVHERFIAEKLVASVPTCAMLAPDIDLLHLAGMLQESDLMIGCDAPPLHLATAVGTPAIGLYANTRPRVSGPYGQIAIEQTRRTGDWLTRGWKPRSITAIGADTVCQAIDELHESTTSWVARAA